MDDELFNDLIESIREAGQINRQKEQERTDKMSFIVRLAIFYGIILLAAFAVLGWSYVSVGAITVREAIEGFLGAMIVSGLIGLGVYWVSLGKE